MTVHNLLVTVEIVLIIIIYYNHKDADSTVIISPHSIDSAKNAINKV